ncbi:MAG: competence/damage-inducible protein A [Lentimicrobium sp.]|jgi:nicotinamide-nucleotide amidase|nr:competence/damage-inducible protein A [Lentimicrobium sp.]
MFAEIVTIGDEILIGQVVDTNSAWMAEQLNIVGVNVAQITSIADNREQILDTLTQAAAHADVVLITGGLGPTRDDITKQTLCEYFDTRLVLNVEALKNIERIFVSRGYALTPVNSAQAELPESCDPLINAQGTASGMWFEKEGKLYVSMPGVPFEMKGLMKDFVLPRLAKINNKVVLHRTVLTQGVGESFLADKISDWEDTLPAHIKLAYLPQPGIVRLRLSGRGKNKKLIQLELDNRIEALYKIIPDFIFGEGADTLEGLCGSLLRDQNLTLATAESCTGGYIAHLITSIAGSSDYFKGSVVSYANEVKEKVLGVSSELLNVQGAVSEEVVVEMAQGAKKLLNVDCVIAVSGIAGPGGGSPEKPVGTIWICLITPGEIKTRKFLFGDQRDRNIRRTALAALAMLHKALS